MAIFAHPDDAEFFAGGLLASWAARGVNITLVLATSGDKGSDDPEMTSAALAALRETESQNAARVLGMETVIFLRYQDGELTPSLDLRRDLTRQIRLHKPDVVVTCDPTAYWYGTTYINHPDHRAIGEAVLAAVFPAARDRLNFIEQEQVEGLSTHKAQQIYLAGPVEMTTVVNITDHIETKIAALCEHKSQFAGTDEQRQRVRDRALDAKAPTDAPRYVEYFRVMHLN